ncbi:glycolate oxidase subunit GlcE [Methylomonas sp. MgM2]
MPSQDLTQTLQQRIKQAVAETKPLRIVGADSKAFYGGPCDAIELLELSDHCGLIDYEPSELVITARAGTRLSDISETLAGRRQALGFEPPNFAGRATLGGTLACGFSGPRRPFAGSARDFTLGCKIVNGHGDVLNFGGRVMKNVAGFDVPRLMVGALGTLGVILEASLRVVPMPEFESTVVQALSERQALVRMNELSGQPWPLSAMTYDDGRLRLRFSGAETAVRAAIRQVGGDADVRAESYWRDLTEQQLAFFQLPGDLWRISVAPATPALELSGRWLLDWGGALRWLKTDLPSGLIHVAAQKAGAHAVCYQGAKNDWFRLDDGLLALQQHIRKAFDPLALFNPGRLLL